MVCGPVGIIYELLKDSKKKEQKKKPKIVKNYYINEDHSVENIEIKDSVINRSQVGGKGDAFKICPYCRKKFDFVEPPRYCPYCEKQILK